MNIIFGLGVSGLSSAKLLNLLKMPFIIINQGDPKSWSNLELIKDLDFLKGTFAQDSDEANDSIAKAGLIIMAPGIPKLKCLEIAKVKPICEIEFCYQKLTEQGELPPIIAITGTNGKTTTVSFLEECFNKSAKSAFVGGNIGTPLSEYLISRIGGADKVDYILLELSSFQLELMDRFRAHIACILNITFSHAERYDSLESYRDAKLHIFERQSESDHAIYDRCLESNIKTDAMRSSLDLNGISQIKSELEKVIKLDEINLYGDHNYINLYFALKIWQSLNLSSDAFISGAKSFKGVSYRLERLPDYQGHMVFNDAKSTNWDATITALKSVKDLGDVILIIGGKIRSHDELTIAPLLDHLDDIGRVLLIGETAKHLKKSLVDNGFFTHECGDLAGVKAYIQSLDKKSVILFSPGFPSFDQFKNYVQRGKAFSDLFSEQS